MEYCDICPRKCKINRSLSCGFCGAGDKPKVARIGLHHYEEPCISGTRGSGAVFFSGCNLRCVFCQNLVLQNGEEGKVLDEAELAKRLLWLQNEQHAHNINLVTPTPHAVSLVTSLRMAKDAGLVIPVVYNTNAYEYAETISKFEGLVDIWLPDFKYRDPQLSGRFSKANDYFAVALDAIKQMIAQSGNLKLDEDGLAQSGVLIRHLVLPCCLYDTRAVLDAICDNFGEHTHLSLMRQFTPQKDGAYPLNRCLTSREYGAAVDYCIKLGMDNVYIQKPNSVGFEYTPNFTSHEEL